MLIAAETNAFAWPIRRVAEAESTQDLAIAAAQTGEAGPLVIIADRQSAGRGRGGRRWVAPDGNLNFSAMVRPEKAPLQAAFWSLLAGVAVYDAIAAHLPAANGLMLKWPNDVLLRGGKLAGVLIDSAVTQAGLVDWVVIGVGVNLAGAPVLPDRPTACLADEGVVQAPEVLARALAAALANWLAAGPLAVRQGWLDRAHGPGTALRVHQGNQVIEGRFAGLAEDGSLRLERPGQREAGIVSGDVFLTDR